ncbi:MAG: PTS sugar transporter subunit IIA [Thermoguttaceae bacterium]|nr:PTS sugar transporter subunit IIA [Thermoguttaceae bacterium]
MQRVYTLEELAKFLRRPPKQLERLADKEILPGRKVQGKWVFALEDVSLWMENELAAQNDADAVALEAAVDGVIAPENDAKLCELLTDDAIFLDFPAKTRGAVVRDLVNLAADVGKVWVPEELAAMVLEREDLQSTAQDGGFAILHARRPPENIVPENFVALAVASRGVPFGGGFGNLTDVFFLVCCLSDAAHLKAIARLARVLKTPGVLDQIREGESPSDVWKIIRDAELSLN